MVVWLVVTIRKRNTLKVEVPVVQVPKVTFYKGTI